VAEPASRLLLVAHGATAGASELVFDDRSPLLRPADPGAVPRSVAAWLRGPEPACAETLDAWRVTGEVLDGVAGPDLGTWAGRPLAEVAAADPGGLQAWLGDVDARPHGGESLADLVARASATLAAHRWVPGLSVLVVPPLVARAVTVAALGAPADLLLALDVGFDARLLLSRSGARWRLQELLRRPPVARPPVPSPSG
jgi:histidine phosphatase superfamily protein (branch 1)